MRLRCTMSVMLFVSVGSAGCGDRSSVRSSATLPANSPAPRIEAVDSAKAASLGLTLDLSKDYRRVCAKQAAYAPPGARACPPLVPDGKLKVMTVGPWSKDKRYSGGFITNLASRSLDRLGQEHIETNGGHWLYAVGWTPAVRKLEARMIERPSAAARPSACRSARLGSQPVETCKVIGYEKGGGLHGGHVVYAWDHGVVTYVISAHGYANEPRVRLMMRALVATVVVR